MCINIYEGREWILRVYIQHNCTSAFNLKRKNIILYARNSFVQPSPVQPFLLWWVPCSLEVSIHMGEKVISQAHKESVSHFYCMPRIGHWYPVLAFPFITKRDGGILLTLRFSFCRTLVVYKMPEHQILRQYFLLI